MGKPIICIDFDGVIHRYNNGWQNGAIYDRMVDGFIAWAHRAREHFTLVIYSSRSKTPEGVDAMAEWLNKYLSEEQPFTDPVLLEDFEFASEKPPAWLTIDDRALCFNGNWSDPNFSVEAMRSFNPWNKP
jgi:hypothetical protein